MHYDGKLSWLEYQEVCDSFIEALTEDMRGYLGRKEYSQVNQFLRVATVPDTDHAILLEILRITLPYSNLLNEREGFYCRVRSEIRRTQSEITTAHLLRGLQ